ncbi:hypothetical protein R3P38DRAFT_3320077 [Favolaschia claudopus]|uniref:DUF6534 domain-containing protein n=1 Tax=Favolaschia claudopus TaxID=2862362 RepID=A0AAW0AZF6_9AGAR
MAPVVIPGVNVLGYMWNYWLYGMLIVQVYFYSQAFPNDGRGIKAFVWILFTLETIYTIFVTIGAWNAYGPGWGDPDTLEVIDWSWIPLPTLNGLLAAMAQGFYIWRIMRLTKMRWFPVLIGCAMVSQFTVSVYYNFKLCLDGRRASEIYALSPEVTFWLAGIAVCDISISITLVSILMSQKRRTMFQRTTGLINRLILFSIETACITSIGATVDLILWLTCGQWNFHFILFLTLGKLYSNVLMATLNSRAPIFTMERASTATQVIPQSGFWTDVEGATAHASSRGVLDINVADSANAAREPDCIVMTGFDTSHLDTLDTKDSTGSAEKARSSQFVQ